MMRLRSIGSALLAAGMLALGFASCLSMDPSPQLSDAVRDFSSALPVFPGAEGFGTDTPAGRGGQIIRVTSLAAEGPGSLREALETPGPRTIIFEVGGVIDTTHPLVIAEPCITVAGQTAPSPGITIIGAGLVVVTHDVLVQHVRFRVGDRPEGPDPGGRDGISVVGNAEGTALVYNVIIDHCSISWALDEGASTWHPGVSDVTFSHSIIAENLSKSLHPEVEHSKGLLIGDHAKRIAVIGNLFAHNMKRSPIVKGDVSALIVNNLIYNPGKQAIHFGDLENSGPSLGAVIGNTLIPGPDTRRFLTMINILIDAQRATRVYALDNDAGGRSLSRALLARSAFCELPACEESPIRVTPLTIRPHAEAAEWVLASAGARPAERDEVDERIVESVRQRTGAIIDSTAEVGGFPNPAPAERKLTLPEEPDADADGDGYTNLEEWLHDMAAHVEGGAATPGQ